MKNFFLNTLIYFLAIRILLILKCLQIFQKDEILLRNMTRYQILFSHLSREKSILVGKPILCALIVFGAKMKFVEFSEK